MNKTLQIIILIITFLTFINCYNSSSEMSSSPNKRQRLTPVLKSSSTSKATSSINEDNTLIKLLSWNIDGIRDENLESDDTKKMRILQKKIIDYWKQHLSHDAVADYILSKILVKL